MECGVESGVQCGVECSARSGVSPPCAGVYGCTSPWRWPDPPASSIGKPRFRASQDERRRHFNPTRSVKSQPIQKARKVVAARRGGWDMRGLSSGGEVGPGGSAAMTPRASSAARGATRPHRVQLLTSLPRRVTHVSAPLAQDPDKVGVNFCDQTTR